MLALGVTQQDLLPDFQRIDQKFSLYDYEEPDYASHAGDWEYWKFQVDRNEAMCESLNKRSRRRQIAADQRLEPDEDDDGREVEIDFYDIKEYEEI